MPQGALDDEIYFLKAKREMRKRRVSMPHFYTLQPEFTKRIQVKILVKNPVPQLEIEMIPTKCVDIWNSFIDYSDYVLGKGMPQSK